MGSEENTFRKELLLCSLEQGEPLILEMTTSNSKNYIGLPTMSNWDLFLVFYSLQINWNLLNISCINSQIRIISRNKIIFYMSKLYLLIKTIFICFCFFLFFEGLLRIFLPLEVSYANIYLGEFCCLTNTPN